MTEPPTPATSGHDVAATLCQDVAATLRQAADQEGFVLCGITDAVDSPGFKQLARWVELGYAAGMGYFASRLDAYRHPDRVLEGARSVAALAYPYAAHAAPPAGRREGRIARYAWSGDDYHDVIRAKLHRVCDATRAAGTHPDGHPVGVRGVVDTAPLMEREIAELAGLGWRGKNTLLLRPGLGSYFFLACVLVDLPLPADPPFETFHCGTCTACLDACPTDAFPQPGVLDASRCISYLTIEHRGPIPTEFREPIGDWVFGCDICQDVCPWNRKPARHAEHADPPLAKIDLHETLTLTEEGFRKRFRKTPLWRARRQGLLRNAAIVLGNRRDPAAETPLAVALDDPDPVVRAAAAWALGRLDTDTARDSLHRRATQESDPAVLTEIKQALT